MANYIAKSLKLRKNSDTYELNLDILNSVYPVGSIYMSVSNTSPSTLFGGTWEQIVDKFLLCASSTSAAEPTYTGGATGGSTTASYTPEGTVDGHTLTTDEIPSHNHGLNSHTHTYSKANASTNAASPTTTEATSLSSVPYHNHGMNGFNIRLSTTNPSSGAPNVGFTSLSGAAQYAIYLNATEFAGVSNPSHSHGLNSHKHTNTYASTDSGAASGDTESTGGGDPHSHDFTGTEASISTMPPYLAVYVWKRIS